MRGSIPSFLFFLVCLLIGTMLWFSCVSWLNYVMPCGEACAPTQFQKELLGMALVYAVFFPILIAPTLLLLLIISLIMSLFPRRRKP